MEKRLVTFDRTSRGNLMYGGPARYWVENIVEALDTPGQWYLDRSLGRLYYLPLPGEDTAYMSPTAPASPCLTCPNSRRTLVSPLARNLAAAFLWPISWLCFTSARGCLSML